jgi:glycine/D-amino acid oxidase-like deaminating enzyme
MSNTFDDNRSVWLAHAGPSQAQASTLVRDMDCDIAIVGGGFTGTSTAYAMALRFPEKRIVLCEARRLGNGASGRNGGLVLNGVHGVGADDVELAKRVFDITSAAIDGIERRIRENRLPVSWKREAFLEVYTSERRAEQAARDVERLAAVGVPLRYLSGRELSECSRFEGAVGAVMDPTTAQVNGVELVRAMGPLLQSKGVLLFEQTPVLGIEEGETMVLRVPGASLRAKAVVLATNAYTPRLGYFGSTIVPVHSHVIATEPLSAARWEQLGWHRGLGGFSDDYDRIAYGSMTDRGELVFGGGSNAAYGYGFGNATVFRGNPDVATRAVTATFHRYFPNARGVRIAHRWSGPVALTMNRICSMGVQGKYMNVYYALGYSGHGIALANLAGEVLSDLYAGDARRWEGLPFFRQRMLFVPPEPFRWFGYHAYTALTGRSPRRSHGG